MQDSLKTIASIPEAEIYHQYSQHGATRILQNSWQDPRHSKGFPEDHSKGADCNFSWICMSYSGKSGRFLNYLNLWAYLEYLFIYQGDPISNFHHVNQMPPISPKKKILTWTMLIGKVPILMQMWITEAICLWILHSWLKSRNIWLEPKLGGTGTRQHCIFRRI